MDLKRSIQDFVSQGKDLYDRLQSDEADTLTQADLLVLQVQLHFLVTETSRLLKAGSVRSIN